MFNRFFLDLKKHYKYAVYSARSDLKTEVANSRLNWLWWIFDPLCFMLVYMFVSVVVFKSTEKYFPVFVFIGLTLWDFFNKCVISSVKLIRNNRAIVTKVYIPKHILLINRMFVNGFKMLISFGIIIILMVIYRVPLSLKIFNIIPILIILFVITFGVSSIVMHFGVFVEDLYNVMHIVLRLMFYFTGIFYSVENRIPAPYNYWMTRLNPLTFVITAMRNSLLYCKGMDIKWTLIWLFIGTVLALVGIKIIYKYENSYVKMF